MSFNMPMDVKYVYVLIIQVFVMLSKALHAQARAYTKSHRYVAPLLE